MTAIWSPLIEIIICYTIAFCLHARRFFFHLLAWTDATKDRTRSELSLWEKRKVAEGSIWSSPFL